MRDPFARRALLDTIANPNERIDYLVTLEGRSAPGGFEGPATVRLRYVPDRRIVRPDAFHRHLDALADDTWNGLEIFASAALDDVNNEVVPRWVQVTVTVAGAAGLHAVTLEDRQPRWDNPTLIGRLKVE